ncbi:SGNH/GDSL hydrolase family protein [Citricoccus sp. GCM10030269]|uniref:SGNH/GDSL hydrolase family protein n=1 Tax=Citricoccus sp. GCM10030269 TaxID=3273388 RepID=UPI003620D326
MSNNGVTKKLQWAALVVLVVAIIALLVVLFTQQRSYRADAEAARGGGTAVPSQESTATADPSSSESSESPESSASETSEAPDDPVEANTTAAQDVVNGTDDAVISVLGDSTSNTSNEWVYLWAEELGADARVSVYSWNAEIGDWYAQPREFGQGERTVTIWNGSEAEATPEFALSHDLLQPEEANLVILNYGHRGSAEEVESSLTELLDALGAGSEGSAPVVLTAQNPATGDWAESSEANEQVVRAAAEERGLPLIDVHAAFEETGDPASLMVDAIHPSEQGSQVWAETVSSFFAS